MDCINVICLYLRKYISDAQFESVFYDNLESFQRSLEEDIYLDIISTRFSSEQELISLGTELQDYVLKNYALEYNAINDAYVECIINSGKEDIVVELLKGNYHKREVVELDCSVISTQSEFICSIKQVLQYPNFCGNNWDAINDLIYDIILPQKFVLRNWQEVDEKLPQDAAAFKSILDKCDDDRCVVIYA